MPEPSAPSAIGRFRIGRRLGSGGLAVVFEGTERLWNGAERVVAVKRLHTHHMDDAAIVEMFTHEAKVLSWLEHPAIPALHDQGRDAGSLYLAMDRVAGRDLEAIAGRVAVAPDIALALVAQLLEALVHVHERMGPDGSALRIVHRDVAPSNVLVTAAGDLKLIDFGIANSVARTHVGTGGSKGYTAPEVITGAVSIDSRADLFGVGVIAHELLSGERLYDGDNVRVMQATVEREAPSLLGRRSQLPAEVDAWVRRALARDRSVRFASAREMVRALREVAGNTVGLAPRSAVGAAIAS